MNLLAQIGSEGAGVPSERLSRVNKCRKPGRRKSERPKWQAGKQDRPPLWDAVFLPVSRVVSVATAPVWGWLSVQEGPAGE
jgi:hypothetical protein